MYAQDNMYITIRIPRSIVYFYIDEVINTRYLGNLSRASLVKNAIIDYCTPLLGEEKLCNIKSIIKLKE
jgi:hypothetical protein